jgi:DNA-binding XRE family transcriptional regulator
MKPKILPSKRAGSEIEKLGGDIAIARKRRRLTQRRLADGAGISVGTVQRLEKGDAGVSLGALAMVFLVLGEHGRLANLLDVARDDMGMVISVNDLPQRVREKGGRGKKGVDGGRQSPVGYDSDGNFVGY